jgi:hypothetical protein
MSDDELSALDEMVVEIRPWKKKDLERTVSIISRLHELGKTKLLWIVFSGYDADRREVWTIPECIRWAKVFIARIGDKISVLADDLSPQPTRLALGIAALHVVAGYGTCRMRLDGNYEMTVSRTALDAINLAHGHN